MRVADLAITGDAVIVGAGCSFGGFAAGCGCSRGGREAVEDACAVFLEAGGRGVQRVWMFECEAVDF